MIVNYFQIKKKLSLALPNESASFLYVLYIFYNTLYTKSKISRKDMFDIDTSDDEYYFEPDKIEDDDSTLGSGNEQRSTRNTLRRFNISTNRQWWWTKYWWK